MAVVETSILDFFTRQQTNGSTCISLNLFFSFVYLAGMHLNTKHNLQHNFLQNTGMITYFVTIYTENMYS